MTAQEDEDDGKVRRALSLSLAPPGSEGFRNLDGLKEVGLKTGGGEAS